MPDNLNNLDRLIDKVAREMTGARVDEGFASRVSSRIQDADADAGAARAPRVWSRTWLLAPAAAGVALLAVLLVRDMPASVRLKPDATADTTAAVVGNPATAAAKTASPQVATAVTTTAGRGQAAPRPALFQLEPVDPDLLPQTPAPIEIASLDVSPLVVAMPIQISAIAIGRIEIAAMP